jgi:hypothetical protein
MKNDNLEKKLWQSVQEIRSRYDYDINQFTIDLFDEIELRINDMEELGVDITIGSLCYKTDTILEIINPNTTDYFAVRDLNEMLNEYYNVIC